jgi:hypothetical protein
MLSRWKISQKRVLEGFEGINYDNFNFWAKIWFVRPPNFCGFSLFVRKSFILEP